MPLSIVCCCCKRAVTDLNAPHARWLAPSHIVWALLLDQLEYNAPTGWAHTSCADDADFWVDFYSRFLVWG